MRPVVRAGRDYERWSLEYEGLIRRALDRDESAWRLLVDRLSGVAWKVLNSYDLEQADREDAFASTFFYAFQALRTVREPKALPGWIATIARNEAYALAKARKRVVPMEELPLREVLSDDVDSSLLDNELLRAVMAAFQALPAKAQALLRLLTAVPPLSYNEISQTLGIPKGSIGPTAGRYLEDLRVALRPYTLGCG